MTPTHKMQFISRPHMTSSLFILARPPSCPCDDKKPSLEGERDPGVDPPGRLNGWVPNIDSEEVELLVEEIRRSHREKAVSLGQTVADGHIHGPEFIAPGLRDAADSHEIAPLVEVGCGEESAESGIVEVADPERDAMGIHLRRYVRQSLALQALEKILDSQSQPATERREEVRADEIFVRLLSFEHRDTRI